MPFEILFHSVNHFDAYCAPYEILYFFLMMRLFPPVTGFNKLPFWTFYSVTYSYILSNYNSFLYPLTPQFFPYSMHFFVVVLLIKNIFNVTFTCGHSAFFIFGGRCLVSFLPLQPYIHNHTHRSLFSCWLFESNPSLCISLHHSV